MLQATNIHKSYQQLKVLRGVDFQVRPAEVVAIVGKSGAGKSTLLHILGTLDQPDQGTVTFENTDTSRLSAKALAAFRNQHIGFIFQFHHLLPEFTALENVCIPGFILKTPEQQVRKRATELLDYLGLSDRLRHKPSQLSGGEQQRVAVARALVNQPKIVFADEPSGNLDSTSSKELHQMLFQLRDDFQQAYVIVTHNESLANMSDRKVTMQDGLLVG